MAAVFFSATIFALLRFVYYAFINPALKNAVDDAVFLLMQGLPCIATGLYFSVTKTVLIDTDTDKLISRFCLGSFSRDSVSDVPQLEYVAVFLDAKDYYEVNLWYEGNKHYQMYLFEEKEPAMEFAKNVSRKLKLDLLDATVRNDSQWIDYQSD